MCKSPLHPLLTALPKYEHHVHLEGTLSPSLLFTLAAKNNISLPPSSPSPSSPDPPDPAFLSPATLSARYTSFSSLSDFLHYYYLAFRVLLTPADFESLTYSYLSHAARSANLRHAEVFFDPQGHTSRGVPISHVVDGFLAAAARIKAEFGLTATLTPCLLRDFSVEDGLSCLKEMISSGFYRDGKLIGLGLCGTEISKPPAMWKPIFDLAKHHGIHRTAHAGEEGPAAYVRAAVEEFGLERVDHGVRAAEEEEVVGFLVERGVMLTMCPVSNVALKGFASLGETPVRRFLDRGVRFSLNSDDPAYFGGYLQDVYCAVEEAFGLSAGEWETIARNAVEGSWCSQERKAELLDEVEKVLRGWTEKGE
ncbi:adenosine deaminase [Podospora aff. communis PSN243]|uniref:Adenine deaminase n=1 Tax=Podospora aff. communis PSN243 TaxID=3040156 RepID=A0AAV9H563_9PEZI|nr:adenosine deaminase [Podospora aff. communis PSN243]